MKSCADVICITEDSIVKNLDDVAGIRVICPFISDIYTIANLLTSQDDITVLKIKDYIKAPKSNGYRSYHMIVEIRFSLQRENFQCAPKSRSARSEWISGQV